MCDVCDGKPVGFEEKRMAFFGDDTEYPMKCPRCGCEDDLSWDVVGTVYSGDSRPTEYWTAWEHFDARCHECDHESTIASFVSAYFTNTEG